MKPFPYLVIAALLAVPAASAQSDFSSLEELMTGSEFEEAGLDKLSEEELRNLNTWLRTHLESADSDVDSSTDKVETRRQIREEVEAEVRQEQGLDEHGEIVTTIPGHFTGWTGNTVFELANGQVWRQTSGGSYRVSKDDPTVVIYPVSFGGWRLRLEDVGPSIGVERVK
jgi:hypothetical protein